MTEQTESLLERLKVVHTIDLRDQVQAGRVIRLILVERAEAAAVLETVATELDKCAATMIGIENDARRLANALTELLPELEERERFIHSQDSPWSDRQKAVLDRIARIRTALAGYQRSPDARPDPAG